jgi:hypothetical protein
MSTSIKLKKSSISGRIPSTGDLDYGELAINYADGILYFKNSGNTVQSINASPSGVDSTATINLIDSAYIEARVGSTTTISEGTNLYYTEARVQSLVDSDYVKERQLKSHAIGGKYRFDTSTTAGDPGSGDIRFSIDWTTGTQGSSYYAYVSETDKDGIGIAPLLDQLTVSTSTNKALVIIYKADAPTTNAKFYVTGQTDNGSYRTLDITYVDRDAWGAISNGDEIFMSLSIIGDKGAVGSSVDSAATIALIDSAYVQARQVDLQRDSAFVTNIVDSSYIQNHQIKYTNNDFADSAFVTTQINNLIDAAPGALDTLNELAAAIGDDANFSTTITNSIAAKLDSTGAIALIDSAYVQARQINNPTGVDSAATIALIDSAYVQARQIIGSSSLDSAAVVNIIDSAVNQTFVNNLNVNADTLDGQEGSYYLNYNNLTNVPAGGASSPQGVDYGSIIVTATNAIDLLIAAFTVDYGTPNAPAGLISDYGAI